MTVIKDEQKTKQQLIEELERLRARIEELETSENVYRQEGEILHIFRINSPIGMFIVQDRKFVFANDQFQRVTGTKAEKLVGTHPLDPVLSEDREIVRQNAIKMLKGELTAPYVYRIKRKDSQIRWIREGVISVQYQGRRAALGHSLDITESIEAEVKLRELYENEKKLRQELEDEVRKRIRFTRALVHELKTPLTPVLFSSELLLSEIKEEPLLSIARNIYHGADNLNNRIDELLDLARVEIGSLQIEPKMVDPQQILEHIAEYVESLFYKHNQRLIKDISPNLPQVWADEERLQQIILNLLVNASKFTQKGGTITLAARAENNSFIVEVKDNGPGISKKEQQRIFEPYERRKADRERLGGLGLGLSLCKNLVSLHGGEIWVESRVGKGSTFTFSIPIEASVEEGEMNSKEKTSEITDNRG
jgi:PAS domain S-box-containing protein